MSDNLVLVKAVTISAPGGPDVLTLADLEDPVADRGEVRIRVAAAGVNRADLAQRVGEYPPPAGAPEWPGLEVSGIVDSVGDGVRSVEVGDRVCALLSGGGYAELAVVPAGQVLPVPDSLDLLDAAGLPEALATVWSNVFMTANLRSGETLLVHGGAGGIGTMAIQLARAMGSYVAVTAGSRQKLDVCLALGADLAINYNDEDFVERITAEAGGADVILDAIGGSYLHRNLRALATGGRLVLIGNQSRIVPELDIGLLMGTRASIHGTTVRSRPADEKARIMASVHENAWPLVESGLVRPIVHARLPLGQAAEAHRILEDGAHVVGKVLLTTGR